MASSEKKNRPAVVSRFFLLDLAGELKAEWLDVGRYLNVSDTSLHNVKVDNTGNVKEAKFQMLICWKEANGQKATLTSLANALLRAGRKDLSEKVKHEEYIVKKRLLENEPYYEPTANSSKRHRITKESSATPSPFGENLTTIDMRKRKQLLKELKKKYRNLCGGIQPVPFLRDKYDIEELFVESGIKLLEGKQKRGKEQERWTGLKNYKAVFTDPRVKSSRRIIDSEPGYGKSTLALQITYDWCQGTAPMDDVEILVLLRLRQFKSVPTVYSAIKNFLLPKDSKLTVYDIEGILDTSSTLILFDGYDEYPGRGKEDALIELIIREEMCQEYDVILTTRTSCLPPDYSRDTKIIRLTGYDDTARDAYIRNVVARGSPEDARKINQFFRDNPVPAEIGQNPLFFAMISFMVHLQERFFNMKTVTDFFRHIIKCFCTFKQSRVAKGKRKREIDHSSLNKITFQGLCGDSQQLSWGKEELISKIGTILYKEYVHIGLLIEEDGYDYDAMEYKTETSFYHKLFVEWYAAHHLVEEASKKEAEFEPWPYSWKDDPKEVASRSRRRKRKARSKKRSALASEAPVLRSLDPDNVHFMYRYACGLNYDAALKIIEHLGKNPRFDEYTMLCITEWGGSFKEVASTITLLCSRGIRIDGNDSVMLQKSTVELLKFASEQKIHIELVRLYNCLDVGSEGDLRLKPSNMSLPIIDTNFEWLHIHEFGREITEEETDSILQYASMCMKLQFLQFDSCLLPRCIKTTEPDSLCLHSMHLRDSSDVAVLWDCNDCTYLLNFISGDGQWEDFSHCRKRMTAEQDDELGGRKPMTDEQYQEAVAAVREMAELKKQDEQEQATTSSGLL